MGNKSPPSDWTYPLEDIVREILAFYRGISDLFHKKGKKRKDGSNSHIPYSFFCILPLDSCFFPSVCHWGL